MPSNYLPYDNSFYPVGCGLLIYQLFVYPFIVKYLGPIRPLRPAVVCEIYIIVKYLGPIPLSKKKYLGPIRLHYPTYKKKTNNLKQSSLTFMHKPFKINLK